MANELEIYKNNSKTLTATVAGIGSLSGYTGVMTVRTAIDATGTTFSCTGTTVGLAITFELTPTMTNKAPDNYHYDIVLSNGTKNYTAVQSIITILDSVKY